jgi:hypothetical protein
MIAGTVVFVGALVLASRRPVAQVSQADLAQVAIDTDDIGGVVTSAKGPEAGVWVIAETIDLPTMFRRIVVTDDRGRYVVPDLPKASYKVWVRGYGLVDSAPVQATPGQRLALTGVIAPNARAAAQYYPSDYWYSLLQIPPKSAFPMAPEPARVSGGRAGAPAFGEDGLQTGGRGGGRGNAAPQGVESQAEWVSTVKGCIICHQMGNKAIRELSPGLGKFDSTFDAWERRVLLGQNSGGGGVDRLGHQRGLQMYADWTDRIMAGEIPPAPPRPAGLERNLVVTEWDFGSTTAFIHDAAASDKNHPGVNGYGPIYGAEWGHNTLEVLDPSKNIAYSIKIPLKDEAGRMAMRKATSITMQGPSPYWGEEVIHEEMLRAHVPYFDSRGNLWFNSRNMSGKSPAFCQPGSDNPYTKYWPLGQDSPTAINYYDQKTGKFGFVETCFNTHHIQIANDPDETIFASGGGLISWLDSKVFLETGDAEKAQGWCPAVIDYNGDGKIGPFTRPPEPADNDLDRQINGGGYGVAWNPKDGSIWYASGGGVPGQIVRIDRGSKPPQTCKAEIYQPPYNNASAPGVMGATPRGIDIDTNGIVWTALATTGQLASFDRSKCKVLTGPSSYAGQHCAEGWTLYPIPGLKFKGVTDQLSSDFLYYNWVDRHDTLGMGANTPIATGTSSDSLLALDPNTKQWVVLRVPYPLGFYTRGLDGRIDNATTGWKGRGLWAANETRTVFHDEGGKGNTSRVAHFQLRPNPLAK